MSRAGGHEPTHTTEEWPSGSGRQHGRLNLDLAPVTGVTRPLLCQAHPPLQLSRVRYDIAQQPEMAHLTILHLGGILAGDRYDFQVTLAPKAAAQISGAAATQVYRMPAGDAQQQIHIRMAAGSRLRWLPGPLILGSGARFTQQIRIELADSARLAFLDVLVPGRLAHGELYRFAAYRHRLTVHDPHGRLLYTEQALIEPQRRNPARLGSLATTPILGSLYLLGDTSHTQHAICRSAEMDDPLLGISSLPNNCGLLIRARGTSAYALTRRLTSILEEIAL